MAIYLGSWISGMENSFSADRIEARHSLCKKADGQNGLKFMDLSVLLYSMAKINGVIPSIRPILAKIKETDFRLSADIERQALLAAGEL
jgi:predicted nucleic acid-binding protein